MKTIPIFIICKDRVTCLKKCIEGYLKLGDVKIILIDNGSTYPPMIEFFKESKIPRYENTTPSNDFDDISERISICIKDTLRKGDYDYYIVTDPDVELENPSPELLKYYISVLEHFPDINVVGPMLRIDDIPDCFEFKENMIKSHIEQFWGQPNFSFNNIKVQFAFIDTTFGMYRSNYPFRRLTYGIRVHEPYLAKHLDWYLDTKNISPEQRYYVEHASKVSTLSNYIIQGYMG